MYIKESVCLSACLLPMNSHTTEPIHKKIEYEGYPGTEECHTPCPFKPPSAKPQTQLPAKNSPKFIFPNVAPIKLQFCMYVLLEVGGVFDIP